MNNRRQHSLLALLFFISSFLFGQDPYSWLIYGGGNNPRARDVVTFPNGDFVVGGTSWGGPVDFNGTSALNGSQTIGFLSKFSSTGQCQWINGPMGIGSNGFVELTKIAKDNNGNLFASGRANDSVSFGSTVLSYPSGSSQAFLAKYDNAGNFQWARQFGDPYTNNHVEGLETDASGNVYVSGVFNTFIDFGNGVILSSPQNNSWEIYLVKFSPSGNAIWAKNLSGPGSTYAKGLHINDNDNIFLTGYYDDSVSINGSIVSGTGMNNFVVSFDSAGNTRWVNNVTNASGSASGKWATGITANAQDECYLLFRFNGILSWNGTAIVAPTQTVDLTAVKLSASGNILWHHEMGGPQMDEGGEICLDASGNVVIGGNFPYDTEIWPNVVIPQGRGYYSAVFDTAGNYLRHYVPNSVVGGFGYAVASTPDGGHLLVGDHDYIDIGSAVHDATAGGNVTILKAAAARNTITGNVFRDFNGNGNRDAGEYGYQGVIVQANTGPYFSMSRQNGDYSMYPDTGAYTLTVPSVPVYHTLLTASQSAAFSTYNNLDSLNDFALFPMPGVQDLVVDLVPNTWARLTGQTYLALAYANIGTDSIQNATIRFTCDTIFNMVSSSVSPTTYVNDTAEWVLPNIRPGDYGVIRISLSITDTTAALGDSARFFVDFLPTANDTTPLDNHDEYRDTLRGAYDPNDKLVSQTIKHPDEAANGDYLTYTIRFQNTGTDTAFTVIIEDTLDGNLDLTSLKMVGASHAYDVSMHHRSIKFIFNQIMLPDSNVNEPASHGFIRYRIRPVQGLGIGDEMRNTAHIYFDSNPAIVTNTTLTRVDTAASVSVRPPVEPDFLTLYPNPNHGEFYLQTDFDNREPVRVEMMDLQGRKVMTDRYTCPAGRHSRQYSVQDLPAGVYFLRLQAQGKVAVRKVVVR